MTLLKVKAGVTPKHLVIAAAAINAALALQEQGVGGIPQDVVITAGTDGRHMVGSKHYEGAALDIRTRTFKSSTAKRAWLAEVLRRLGPGYQGFIESEGTKNEHAHVEYDPS